MLNVFLQIILLHFLNKRKGGYNSQKINVYLDTHTFLCHPRQMCRTPGPSAGLVRWEHLPSACLLRCCAWIKTSQIECSVCSVPTAKDQQRDAGRGAGGHHLQQEERAAARARIPLTGVWLWSQCTVQFMLHLLMEFLQCFLKIRNIFHELENL